MIWTYMDQLLKKNQLSRCLDCISLLHWVEALTIRALIRSQKFISPKIGLYLYKSIIHLGYAIATYELAFPVAIRI